jgi:glutamine cyclotransferase
VHLVRQTGLCLLLIAAVASCERYPHFSPDQLGTTFTPTDSTTSDDIPIYTYEIVNAYPHDSNSFTQGLVYRNGFLYEGTGQYPYFAPGNPNNGLATLRKVALETGEILQSHQLDQLHFGEGVAILGDEIVQLTWLSQLGIVYDLETFQPKREFVYGTEGWGITHDGFRYIMSDGTASLYFRDSQSLNEIGRVEVRDNRGLVWQTDLIARINALTGRVIGWIDLTGLLPDDERPNNSSAVLNGIAYDAESDRLFVTGKLWPKLFEIRLKLKE